MKKDEDQAAQATQRQTRPPNPHNKKPDRPNHSLYFCNFGLKIRILFYDSTVWIPPVPLRYLRLTHIAGNIIQQTETARPPSLLRLTHIAATITHNPENYFCNFGLEIRKMRGKPGGYDLPGPPIEVSTSHDANTRLFFIYAPPLYYFPM